MVRASSSPLAYKCAGSIFLEGRIPGEIEDDDESSPSSIGTIAHAAIAEGIRKGRADIDDLAEDAKIPVNGALKMWNYGIEDGGLSPLRDYFEPIDHYIELTLEGDELGGGTVDLGGYNAETKTMYVCDWKTGRVVGDHTVQLARYGILLAAHLDVQPQSFVLITAYCRLMDWQAEMMTADEMNDLLGTLKVNITTAENARPDDLSIYREGSHCTYCRAALLCPARTRMIRSVAALDLPEEPITGELTADNVANAYGAVKWLEAASKRLAAEVRQFVRENGPVPIDDKKSLAFRQIAGRKSMDHRLSNPLLKEHYPEQEVEDCLSMSWSAVQTMVRDNAPPRQKKKHVEAIEEELRTAGALIEGESQERFEPVPNDKLLTMEDHDQ